MADPNELLELVLANDAGFGLYKRQHWERVFREQITPWLAAHDAGVRAGVVAEEPEAEWEYGIQYEAYPNADVVPLATAGRAVAYSRTAGITAMRRTFTAGPWVPVKQGEVDG